ncbi:hypothetical protein JHK87_053739 [Glycine soja]|nr:hypothetical protein JHK87_053739 [Glycine soja]
MLKIWPVLAVELDVEEMSKNHKAQRPVWFAFLLSTQMGKRCGVSEGRFLPCSGVSRRTASAFSCSSQGYHRIHSRVEIRGLKCSSMGGSFVCEARRTPESFSRQNKH